MVLLRAVFDHSQKSGGSRPLKLRLTQIKLAGFKSFVEPTAINVPGSLVGVVGPNGCGKSNIIDAVRWVLGETRASALRGESMQDVIFNGSAQRKPVARASVELVFDNSLGKAAGQWSQFAEISVKRVLQRDGESSYFINNQHVRRRDVQDIFLGTGLGPRAYAIIEQGMISRVIEAKPEDLRVFLEEAAGVSKYKERRRETENRLEDTRENLARVDDIRRELDSQIEKLTHQAEVASQYRALQSDMQRKQNLLWLLRKQDAEGERERFAREVDRTTNELEAETARLREIERLLEEIRVGHYASGDRVNAAQGELFEVNTEISRLESEIRYVSETRQRLERDLAHIANQVADWERRSTELSEARAMWAERKHDAAARIAETRGRAEAEAAKLPDLEAAFRSTQGKLLEVRGALAQAEQTFQIEQTHLAHAGKVLGQIEAREERLRAETTALASPDENRIAELETALGATTARIASFGEEIARLEAALPGLDGARAQALASVQHAEREASAAGARLDTLRQIQSRVDDNEQIHGWLEKHALATLPRLWQKISAEAGWDAALESVLRERLHALELSDPESLQRLLDDPPPAKLSVFSAASGAGFEGLAEHKPLAAVVRYSDPSVRPLIEDWLAGYYAVDGVPRLMNRLALPVGAVLVNRDGHQFRRHSVSFHAPDAGDTGILARQREIEALADEQADRTERLAEARASLERAEAALAAAREGLARRRSDHAAAKQQAHDLQLEHLRLVEGQTRVRERAEQIARELAELADQKKLEQAHQAAAEANLERHQAEIDRLFTDFEAVRGEHDRAAQMLEAQRGTAQVAEREAQEATFAERECTAKIEEIERSAASLALQVEDASGQRETFAAELSRLQDTSLRADLDRLLAVRLEREQKLSAARDQHEELGSRLRGADEERLGCEQRLEPLRNRIGDLRLKEQAARLAYEQYANQLFEAGVDEAELAQSIEKGMRPNALQAEIARLGQAVSDLGAVNLAALDELASSEERKLFLDSQATDLAEALGTLESAIRRIDRETRELLQKTFDDANRNFGELFPTLFGGGDAKLVMTGEEVLDAGVQVMAHPPGKKNTSIHLLSGGEKALTAIALVFALFQLNPAPFCLLDEVDAPLDDTNTERFSSLVRKMAQTTQFLFISHNKITMEIAEQLIGVTMQESGVSRVVAVDIEEALRIRDEAVAA